MHANKQLLNSQKCFCNLKSYQNIYIYIFNRAVNVNALTHAINLKNP